VKSTLEQWNEGKFSLEADISFAYFTSIVSKHKPNPYYSRVGLNFGDVTAGVIGTTKLFYDIWGDSVNIASRMDSTGMFTVHKNK
jgi:hypothetical protein